VDLLEARDRVGIKRRQDVDGRAELRNDARQELETTRGGVEGRVTKLRGGVTGDAVAPDEVALDVQLFRDDRIERRGADAARGLDGAVARDTRRAAKCAFARP
jgi:hypothetical protein